MVTPPELVLATAWILGHGLVDAQFVWPKRAGVVMFPNPPPPSSPAEEAEFTHCLPSTLSGYHYGGNRESAGIYHKRVTTEMTYEEAKTFCEADLAHLATFRTQEEYENLRDHTKIMKNAGIDTIWSALENKELNKCGTTLSSCTNKLTWGDNGTTFTYYYQFMDVGEVKFWNTDDGDYETYCSHMDTTTGAINDPAGGCNSITERHAFICQYDCEGGPKPDFRPRFFSQVNAVGGGAYQYCYSAVPHCPLNAVQSRWDCDSAQQENGNAIWLGPAENWNDTLLYVSTGYNAAYYGYGGYSYSYSYAGRNVSFLALRNAVAPDSGPCGIQVFQLLNYDQDAAGYVPILAGALKDLGSNSCGTQENQIFRFGPLYSAYTLMIKIISLQPGATRPCLQYLDIY